MSVRVAISTVDDGDMRMTDAANAETVTAHRAAFLKSLGSSLDTATRLQLDYEGDDYRRYREVSAPDLGDGMRGKASTSADALITTSPGHALFLTLADCIGAAIYDPVKSVLMLSHLGRHSLEQHGGHSSVQYLIDRYHLDPAQLLVWLSPAPSKDNYPLFAFDGRGAKDVAIEQITSAGVLPGNITDNPADTSSDPAYFSYSESLKGRSEKNGSHAMAAVILKTDA